MQCTRMHTDDNKGILIRTLKAPWLARFAGRMAKPFAFLEGQRRGARWRASRRCPSKNRGQDAG